MPSLSRLALLPFAAATLMAGAAESKSTLVRETPFAPPAQAAGPAQANETIEFAGVYTAGKRTDLIFLDKTAKKNHWIGIGETKEGIAVVSYDERREQAVVKMNGSEKVLQLRKGTGPVNKPAAVPPLATGFNVPTPAPAVTPLPGPGDAVVKVQPPPPAVQPANVPAPAPNTPEAQQKQETEARMLVSDLLEIGMAQRKAYEEAQRKAAEGGNSQSAPNPAQPGQQPKP